jgi:pimeloyl-ACP methyl ester carboxylesterase
MSVQAFEIAIPDATLRDLEARLARTRLPPDDGASDWDAGTSPAFLRDLLEYWRFHYDFRREEAALNRFAQFQAEVDGTALHFIHERGNSDAPMPLLLVHGFPDSFLRYTKLIPLLTDPAAHGGDPGDAFDVVVPSLPGYGFSSSFARENGIFRVGALFHALMTKELGYERFGAHGGDWGSTVSDQLARAHAEALVGIHLTDVPFWRAFQKPRNPTAAEAEYLAQIEHWLERDGSYAFLQGTRTQTLADALGDSPAGLAAWFVDLFRRFSDCHGDVETRFSKDELITNIVLYWSTATIGSAFLPYRDITHAGAARWIAEKVKDWFGTLAVPAGFALFPRDTSHPPREWAERFYNVLRWTPLPRGGHFAAHEEPELLATEIRDFFRPLRTDWKSRSALSQITF